MYNLNTSKKLDYNQNKGMKPLENNQGRSPMNSPSLVVKEDDFELTNCPDPKCYICNMHKGGYPGRNDIDENGRIKLNPYHEKKLADSMTTLLTWIGSADYDCLTPRKGA